MALSRVATHLPARPVVKEPSLLTHDQAEQINRLILRGAPSNKTTYSAVRPWLKMHLSDKDTLTKLEEIVGHRVQGVDLDQSIVSTLPRQKLPSAQIFTPTGVYGIRERGKRKRTCVFVMIHFANGQHFITTVVPADK